MGSERSAAVAHVVRVLEDMRDHAKKRLTTTVEEDKSVQVGKEACVSISLHVILSCALAAVAALSLQRGCMSVEAAADGGMSIAGSGGKHVVAACYAHLQPEAVMQEHFEDVKLRQEKAQSEKAQLQQKLKLDRMQRQRQAGQLSTAQNTASAHLDRLTGAHAGVMRELQSNADTEQTGATARFEACATLSRLVAHKPSTFTPSPTCVMRSCTCTGTKAVPCNAMHAYALIAVCQQGAALVA